ncbi:MAG: hypothetical protein JOY51_05275, partial [Nevskia sp.]|nr:hypothetical protein [Nevskia sp.]
MPYDQAEPAVAQRLPLAPLSAISRRLSTPEYYHAAIGASRHTLDGPRYTAYFVKADSTLTAQQWQAALDRVAAVHPGTRLRLSGHLWWARWRSDGAPPRLRIIEDCAWDTRSSDGAEFVNATPLDLRGGPSMELVVARLRDGSTLLVLRAHHAVADGMGAVHLLHELFRALRGEPLQGANCAFSDVDLMLDVGATHSTSRHIKTGWLTGDPAGAEMGDEWRRISLGAPGKNLLGRVAAAMAEFAHRRSELPALFAVPVNLRRHRPGLLATTNFSNMLFVKLERGEGAEQFTQRLKEMLAQRMETVYPRILDLFRALPFAWFDRMLSRTPKNYRTKAALETAVISNLGRWDAADFSCPGFRADHAWVWPLGGSCFSTLTCMGDRVELTLNLPRVLSGNGRFDELEA